MELVTGIEPATSSLQVKYTAYCVTPAYAWGRLFLLLPLTLFFRGVDYQDQMQPIDNENRIIILLQPIVFTGITLGIIRPDDFYQHRQVTSYLGDRPREFPLILHSQCQILSLQGLKPSFCFEKLKSLSLIL